MSTKKPEKTTGPDELTMLRERAKALEVALSSANASLSDLQVKHSKLVAELARRASGLPVLADLISVAIRMHGRDTAGRTVLQAIEKAIGEMRHFNGGDALPTDGTPAASPGSYAARADEVLRGYGSGERVKA